MLASTAKREQARTVLRCKDKYNARNYQEKINVSFRFFLRQKKLNATCNFATLQLSKKKTEFVLRF